MQPDIFKKPSSVMYVTIMPISSIWASRSITGLPFSQLPTLQIALPRALSKVTSPYSSRSFAAASAAEPSAPDTPAAEDGFLKISGCGGLDTRLLLAQQVTVYGKEKLTGIVTSTPPHLEKDSSVAPDLDSVFIDIGFTSRENAAKYVSLGDRVLIENKAERLAGSRVTSKAIDDRSGCAAILKTLELLNGQQTAYNIAVCFSTQEEVGERGAKTAAFDINADYAIVVDVSFARTHYESEEECGIMGKGAMIGIAPSLSREMSDGFISLAEEKGIPYQLEVMSGKTGTNADAIGVSGSGTKAVTISIPEKHMHTPVEIVDINDIDNTALLIAEYLKRV